MSKYKDSSVKDYKAIFNSMPINYTKSDDSLFGHFSGFINYVYKFIEEQNGSKQQGSFKDKYNYHWEKLWVLILSEFMNPMWCYDEAGFNKNLCEKQEVPFNINNVKIALRDSHIKGEFNSFFKTYPFVKDLLFIDKFFLNESEAENIGEFYNIVNTYKVARDKHKVLLPILVLTEHIKLMLNRDDFDKEFYSKHMKGATNCLKGDIKTQFIFLSLLAGDVPYSVQMSDEAFKKLNWGAFNGLYRSIIGKDFKNIISNKTLESLEKYFENLILFEIGEAEINDVTEVDVSDLAIINAITKIKPSFEIIEHYIRIAEIIDTNDSTARLATLRVVTAVGEAISVIKTLIPTEKIGLLKTLNDLRDHILHSSTSESFQYLMELVNSNDSILDTILIELKSMKTFFTQLKLWLEGPRQFDQFPNMPDLQNIEAFEANYIVYRQKDDRDVILSLADCSKLENPIPAQDVINNNHLDEVVNFAKNSKIISRVDFINFCIGAKKPNTNDFWSKNELKKNHEKITELNKIVLIRKTLNETDFDLDKVSLNLNKSNAEKLKIIKEDCDIKGLQALLSQHEKKNAINIDEFLQSIEKIHLTEHKEVLRKFANEKPVSKSDFETAVQIVFRGEKESQMVWNDAYLKFHGKIDSYKRDQLVQVKYAVDSIYYLKAMVDKIHNDSNVVIKNDSVTAIACEMQFGLCVNNTKTIMKFIDRMYDYNDKSLYFFAFPHPIQEVQGILDNMVNARNNLFHFEEFFKGSFNIELFRETCFSVLENLTHGMFFSDGISISSSAVSRDPITSYSQLIKLKDYLELIQNSCVEDDSDTINVFELTEVPISGSGFDPSESNPDADLH